MLTYNDRLAEIRKTKIQHTWEKIDNQGYMNADDYGTVPLPKDYKVEKYSNRDDGSFFGLDGMSEMFCRIVDAHPVYVDPYEMLCGRWSDMITNYRTSAAWLVNYKTKNQRWDEERFPYEHLKPLQEKYNITSGIDNDAHCAADYSIGLALGFGGLLEKVRHYRTVNPHRKEFYDAEEKCLVSMIDFIKRHIEEIEKMLLVESRPEIRENLTDMLGVNRAIVSDAPKTFHQACQWVAYYNCFSRIYTRDGAGFQLDSLLFPYYERDIESGILDDEKAKFLIADLLLIDPHYYQLSGVDENGNDITNHLSYLILDAADSINIACNLSVRVHDDCDPKFLEKAVECLLKNKMGWPRFCSDRSLSEGYMRTGASIETARQRIAVGCNWMCIPGREFPMNDTVKINIAKVMEVALGEMRSEEEKSSEKLFSIYEKHLRKAVEVTAEGVNLHIDHVAEVTPELIMDLMMHGTIENGLDISQCAEFYTVGVDGAGLAVVADSLGAMSKFIEEEKKLTWEELYYNLDNDFATEKGERIRLMLQGAPRYCQGGTVSDAWAKRLTDSFVSAVRSQKMPNGRQLVPGWFSWSRTIEYGKTVGAMPNGRKAGAPISHGANPNPGFRRDGAVTAQANGIASVQCGYGNTAPLQLEFDPGISADEEGIKIICDLVRNHFEMGGTLININVLDTNTLMEANRDPSLHPDLVVRVTGFTAYFATLSPEFRQLVVDRFLSAE